MLNNRHFWFHFQIFYPSQQVNQWISYRIPASAIYLLYWIMSVNDEINKIRLFSGETRMVKNTGTEMDTEMGTEMGTGMGTDRKVWHFQTFVVSWMKIELEPEPWTWLADHVQFFRFYLPLARAGCKCFAKGAPVFHVLLLSLSYAAWSHDVNRSYLPYFMSHAHVKTSSRLDSMLWTCDADPTCLVMSMRNSHDGTHTGLDLWLNQRRIN